MNTKWVPAILGLGLGCLVVAGVLVQGTNTKLAECRAAARPPAYGSPEDFWQRKCAREGKRALITTADDSPQVVHCVDGWVRT